MNLARFFLPTLVVLATLAFVWLIAPFSGAILWAVVAAVLFDPLNTRLLRAMPHHRNSAALATLLVIGSEPQQRPGSQHQSHHVEHRRHAGFRAFELPSGIVFGAQATAAVHERPVDPGIPGLEDRPLPRHGPVDRVRRTDRPVVGRRLIAVIVEPGRSLAAELVDRRHARQATPPPSPGRAEVVACNGKLSVRMGTNRCLQATGTTWIALDGGAG